MPLFQQSVVNKYLSGHDKPALEIAYRRFRDYFHHPERQRNIREAKEEQFQEGFLRELFVNVLGYTLNPDPGFNLTTEHRNVKDSRKADGAMLFNGEVTGVIELKGTDTTDLGKVESQAFGYKNNQPGCRYVITSNFEKLRFYIDNAIDYLGFDLFTLDFKGFELLWLCLGCDNLRNGVAGRIKEESLSHENEITRALYKDYSLFKRELHQNLTALNPQFDPLTLFKKSQKLLSRLLFLFFAEDRNLLPPNSVRLVLNDWRDLKERDAEVPLYDRFKIYFGYLNTGYKGKRYDVFAYNGGLFKPDFVLDAVIIDDELLYRHTLKLSEYDFVSEVDVNILGHIFENSLNELEEIRAQLEGIAVDKAKTKRKKEGVYYTPKYITKYIVENTVGRLCREKREELALIDEDYTDAVRRQTKTRQALLDKLTAYREWLLQLTICDPACGSGAFLNQALEFLIAEHHAVDELQSRLFGDAMVLSDLDKSILENNLYGVDLNEESVEIARLSLWLRTARPNRTLNDLSANIKVGNSLIDDPAVAGDKAFDWHKEFPHVFAKGGFDVVIGNPPYGAMLGIIEKQVLQLKFSCYADNFDIYSSFIEKAFQLITKDGIWGFINPISWQTGESFYALRKYVSENGQLLIGIKLPYDVFADAYVDTGIYIIKKRSCDNYVSKVYEFPVRNKTIGDITNDFSFFELDSNQWLGMKDLKIVFNPSFYQLFHRLEDNTIDLGTISNSIRGILPNLEDVHLEKNNGDKPYFTGDLMRYEILSRFEWVKYGDHLKEKPKDYSFFYGKRILIRRLINRQFRIMASLTEMEFVTKKDIYSVKITDNQYNTKFILAILNSKLISYAKTKGSTIATKDDFSQLTLADVRTIPIKRVSPDEQKKIQQSVDILMININELSSLTSSFHRTLQRHFGLEDIPAKLQGWYQMSYGEFVKELQKRKVKLTLVQEAEWEPYFLAEAANAQELKRTIDATDREIDRMVYELYGLTEEEIAIVEGRESGI